MIDREEELTHFKLSDFEKKHQRIKSTQQQQKVEKNEENVPNENKCGPSTVGFRKLDNLLEKIF